MITLIRAELLKLHTLRSVWWFSVVAVVTVAAMTVAAMLIEGAPGGALDAGEPGIRSVLSSTGVGTVFMLVFGVVAMTEEFRYSTATATFLTTAHRWRVVAAKAIAVMVVATGFGVLASAATAAIAVPWLTSLGFEVDLLDAGGLLAASTGAIIVNGVLGVGIGALVRNQVGAIAIALLAPMIEALIGMVVPQAMQWLPDGATNALTGWDATAAIPVWGSALVLLGWAAVLATLGSAVVARRDLH